MGWLCGLLSTCEFLTKQEFWHDVQLAFVECKVPHIRHINLSHLVFLFKWYDNDCSLHSIFPHLGHIGISGLLSQPTYPLIVFFFNFGQKTFECYTVRYD